MRDQPQRTQEQLSLFADAVGNRSGGESLSRGDQFPGVQRSNGTNRLRQRTVVIDPHLLAARRIARKMRRLPDRSEAETRAGLAICAQLKAYLAVAEPAARKPSDGQVDASNRQASRH